VSSRSRRRRLERVATPRGVSESVCVGDGAIVEVSSGLGIEVMVFGSGDTFGGIFVE